MTEGPPPIPGLQPLAFLGSHVEHPRTGRPGYRRTLPTPRRGRCRSLCPGLRRGRHAAGSPRRRQAAASGAGRRRHLPEEVPGGGAPGGLPEPPERAACLRLGRRRRHALPGPRVPGWRKPAVPARRRPSAEPATSGDDRRRGRPWARLCPPAGSRPPRHQARQPALRRRRPTARGGLRPRPRARGGGAHRADRDGHGDGPLRLARAGRGSSGGRPHRRLLAGLDPLRVGDRAGAFRRGHDGGDPDGARRRGPAAGPRARAAGAGAGAGGDRRAAGPSRRGRAGDRARDVAPGARAPRAATAQPTRSRAARDPAAGSTGIRPSASGSR